MLLSIVKLLSIRDYFVDLFSGNFILGRLKTYRVNNLCLFCIRREYITVTPLRWVIKFLSSFFSVNIVLDKVLSHFFLCTIYLCLICIKRNDLHSFQYDDFLSIIRKLSAGVLPDNAPRLIAGTWGLAFLLIFILFIHFSVREYSFSVKIKILN